MERARFDLSRLYAILDAETLERRGLDLVQTAACLAGAGVRLMQYREKAATGAEMERRVALVLRALEGSGCRLILNDDPETARRTGCDGVHVGQADVGVALARAVMGPRALIGISTHTREQVAEADAGGADYIAIGPIFQTSSKVDAVPVVGIEGLRWARALTSKPLVAIGGISQENVQAVLAAGADSVAVIAALYREGRSVGENAADLLRSAGQSMPS